MLSINKSFIYGISIASITWIISFYLYLQINYSNHQNSTKLPKLNDIYLYKSTSSLSSEQTLNKFSKILYKI